MTDLLQRIENFIQNRRLLKRGQKMLVAVSGGLDSMVLLHALEKLSARHKWKIAIVHFNHQLRGRASDADEKLVHKTAASMKLPFIVERANVKKFARQSKLSIEMAARKLRHEFFARAARKRKIKTIAFAHHADDQVELFFLRLLRGTGGESLAGMKWNAPSPADKKIMLVRPLLGFSKSELAEFARENKIRFRDDATNFSPDFLRNRIRNELLPLLRRKYQPGLNKTVLRLMEIAGSESDFIGSVTPSLWLDPARPKAEHCLFGDLPVAIQRRVLRSQLERLDIAANFDLVEQLRESGYKYVSIGSGLSVSRDAVGGLKLRKQQSVKFNTNELKVKLSGRAGCANFDSVRFRWVFDNGSRRRSPRQIRREFFEADKIGNKIILRHWRAGDRFSADWLEVGGEAAGFVYEPKDFTKAKA